MTSPTRHRSKVLLGHIVHWGEKLEAALNGKTLREFLSNDLLNEACLHRLQIVGEAANALPGPFRRKHKKLRWDDWIAFRHKLVHGYDAIDMTFAYNFVTQELPAFLAAVKAIEGVEK